jgi:hypothetical protein
MPRTLRDLNELTAVADNDWVHVNDVNDVLDQDKKITRFNLIGTAISGGGAINTGGFTLTVPATGTAALKTGTPVANNVTTWSNANTVKDGGLAFDQVVRRTGSFTLLDRVAQWHDDNTIKGASFSVGDVALLATPQSFSALKTFTAGARFGTSPTTLMHYQEGTWTPALTFGGTANGLTYQASGQAGRYVRIGTMCSVWASLRLATVGSSVGNAVVGGLPFASFNLTFHRPPITTAYASMSFTGALQGINVNNTTDITLQIGNNGVNAAATNANFTNSTNLYINLVYECA